MLINHGVTLHTMPRWQRHQPKIEVSVHGDENDGSESVNASDNDQQVYVGAGGLDHLVFPVNTVYDQKHNCKYGPSSCQEEHNDHNP